MLITDKQRTDNEKDAWTECIRNNAGMPVITAGETDSLLSG